MFLRILIAALAIWGMSWSKEAQAVLYVCSTVQTTVCQDGSGCEVKLETDCGSCRQYLTPPPPPQPWDHQVIIGDGATQEEVCNDVRADRPGNCGDINPGAPQDYPEADFAVRMFAGFNGVPSYISNAIGQLWGCVGGGFNNYQRCASEVANSLNCSYSLPRIDLCQSLRSDLGIIQDYGFIGGVERDYIDIEFSLRDISLSPSWDNLPEWFKELVIRSKEQSACHRWHKRMQATRCLP